MNGHGPEPSIILGLDPLWLSTGILLVAYVFLLSEYVNRTVVALLGGGLVVMTGVLSQDQAFAGIDFNTIALLTGMMIIVSVTRTTGVFEFVAIWSAKKVKADPRGVLLVLAAVTAVFSAFLDNLTTVLLVVPVALLIADKLRVSPYPFLISQIIASNIGGTATLIGDPPNILIGSATGYTFLDFVYNLGAVAVVILGIVLLIFHFVWRSSLKAEPEHRARVMSFEERSSITDHRLLVRCFAVLGMVILGFIVGEHYHIRPGTTAMFGAAVLLLISNIGAKDDQASRRVRDAFVEVEWGALFFFMGLFVIVHGVEKAGLLEMLADHLLALTDNDPMSTAFATLWLSAIVSAAVDNIPFVATMIPLMASMEEGLGGPDAIEPVWWALSLGACLGGNGSLIGAAANVMVAGLGERAGHSLSFTRFAAIGLPIMILSVLVANLYLYLRYYW